MADRLEVETEVTRLDLLEVGKALWEPHWAQAAKIQRATTMKQVVVATPFIIGGAAFFVGRANATSGMYWEGALIGALLAALIAAGMWSLNWKDRVKKPDEHFEQMDFSAHVGKLKVEADAGGVRLIAPSRDMRLAWRVVEPRMVAGHVVFAHGNEGTVLPKRAFATEEEAKTFLEQVRAWWKEGQMPDAERVARYLADRDVACLACKYNLRGAVGPMCPECGAAIDYKWLVEGVPTR